MVFVPHNDLVSGKLRATNFRKLSRRKIGFELLYIIADRFSHVRSQFSVHRTNFSRVAASLFPSVYRMDGKR